MRFETGILHTQASGEVDVLAQFLVETQVAGVDLLGGLVVASLFLEHFGAIGLAETEFSKKVFVDEGGANGILGAGHEALTHLVHGVCLPIGHILVGSITVVEPRGGALLLLAGIFVTKLQAVGE